MSGQSTLSGEEEQPGVDEGMHHWYVGWLLAALLLRAYPCTEIRMLLLVFGPLHCCRVSYFSFRPVLVFY